MFMKNKFSKILVIGLTMIMLTVTVATLNTEDPPYQGRNTDITVQKTIA